MRGAGTPMARLLSEVSPQGDGSGRPNPPDVTATLFTETEQLPRGTLPISMSRNYADGIFETLNTNYQHLRYSHPQKRIQKKGNESLNNMSKMSLLIVTGGTQDGTPKKLLKNISDLT